jgi:hypothetical protein
MEIWMQSLMRRYVFAARKLHADNTPVPVLAPGTGKTKTGRLWTYVRGTGAQPSDNLEGVLEQPLGTDLGG